MGAKMMPMEKKRGRTVFGVRIGLVCGQRRGIAPWEGSPIVDDLLPCLQPLLSKGSVCWLIQPSATCPARYANHLNFPSCPSCPSSAPKGMRFIISRGRAWVDSCRYCGGSWCGRRRGCAGWDSLAGLRLFFLSLDLLPESWEAMESVWPTLVGESAMVMVGSVDDVGVGCAASGKESRSGAVGSNAMSWACVQDRRRRDVHPLFDETAALERVRIPGCLGRLVGWLVFLGTEADAEASEPSRLAAVPLERCRIRAVWQSSVRLWLGSLSQFPVAAAAHLRERKRRSGLGRDMQVPELLRGRLHNLHSSWSRPPEAGRTEMQAVRQYAPCHVRLRV